jgi:hypothetical protein
VDLKCCHDPSTSSRTRRGSPVGMTNWRGRDALVEMTVLRTCWAQALLPDRQGVRGAIVIAVPLLGYGCFLHVFDYGGGEGGGA